MVPLKKLEPSETRKKIKFARLCPPSPNCLPHFEIEGLSKYWSRAFYVKSTTSVVRGSCMLAFDPTAACAQLTGKLLFSNRTAFTSLLCSPCAIPQQVARDMRIRRRALWDIIRLSFRGLLIEQLLQILNDAFWNGSAVKLPQEVAWSHITSWYLGFLISSPDITSCSNNGGTNYCGIFNSIQFNSMINVHHAHMVYMSSISGCALHATVNHI